MPLSREQLDPMRCGNPACRDPNCAGPLVFSGRCHVGAPTLVSYDWTTGVLTISCATCRKGITTIAVAAHKP